MEIFKPSLFDKESDFPSFVYGEYEPQIKANPATPIVIYGAGSAGHRIGAVIGYLGGNVKYFIDSDRGKVGKYVNLDISQFKFSSEVAAVSESGVPIVGADFFGDRAGDFLLIIALSNRETALSIREQMKTKFPRSVILADEAGVPHNLSKIKYFTNYPQWHLSMNRIKGDREKVESAYQLLADEISRELFLDRISLYSNKPSFAAYQDYIAKYSLLDRVDEFSGHEKSCDYLYFNNDIFSYGQDECLYDCGAWMGGVTSAFMQRSTADGFRATSYCFEPDGIIYQKLAQRFLDDERVHVFKRGVWSECKSLHFEHQGFTNGAGSHVTDAGTGAVIEAVALDSIKGISPPTFIKMDLEGSERQALRGARKLIGSYSPKLAISLYHEPDDIYQLPLLVRDLNSNYKFYMRLINNDWTDIVLFAVSK